MKTMSKSKPLSFATMVFISSMNAASGSDNSPYLLRGRQHYTPHRELHLPKPPRHSDDSSHQSTYKGCLGYSDSELSESWIFSDEAPNCSWVHSSGGSSGSNRTITTTDGTVTDDSTSDINNDDKSSYDGEGDKYGGGWDDDSENASDNGDDDGSNRGAVNAGVADDGNSNGYTNGDNNADDNSYSDDEIIVSNEDVNGDDNQYDPIDDFDIQVCETYENLWIWDLALSCDNITEIDDEFLSNAGCSCSFAEELIENNLLSCEDTSLCPNDCRICSICIHLLGCDPEPAVFRNMSALSILYIVGAAVGMLFFGLVTHYSRKHCGNGSRYRNNDLDQNLLDSKEKDISAAMMYMHEGDRAWKPLPSDQEYAASQRRIPSLQHTSTMSTASTTKSRKKDRAKVKSKKNGFVALNDDQEDGGGRNASEGSSSYKSARENESDGSDLYGEDPFVQFAPSLQNDSNSVVPSTVDTFLANESNVVMSVSPIQTLEESSSDDGSGNAELDGFDDEHPLFEDLSPRTIESLVKTEGNPNEGAM